jgi:hypothetical protein
LKDKDTNTPTPRGGPAPRTARLSDPPRYVPFLVQLRILTGGWHNQFGWFLFGFGMAVVWGTLIRPAGRTPRVQDETQAPADPGTVRVDGVITKAEQTEVVVRGSRVVAYTFEFRDVDGQTRQGRVHDYEGAYRIDQKVPLSYPRGKPEAAKIEQKPGGEDGPSPVQLTPALISLVFPIVGLCFVTAGVRKGLKGIRLLRDGKQASGILTAAAPTNTQINGRTVCRFTFEFVADDGKSYKAMAKTHLVHKFGGERVIGRYWSETDTDRVCRPVLYNPANPTDAVVLDELPGGPRIDQDGAIYADNPLKVVLNLIIPGVSIVGHLGFAIHLLF